MTFEQLAYHYNVTKEDVIQKFGNVDRAIRPAMKEIIGERLLKQKNVWGDFFPGVRVIQVHDTELQKDGIDFVADGKNIDIKVSVGDYTNYKMQDIIPIELTQNGKRTITEDKKTDYMLYLNINLAPEEYKAYLIPYSTIMRIVDINIDNDYMSPYWISDRGTSEYTSKSVGCYIRFPVELLDDEKVVELSEGEIIDYEERMKAIFEDFKNV